MPKIWRFLPSLALPLLLTLSCTAAPTSAPTPETVTPSTTTPAARASTTVPTAPVLATAVGTTSTASVAAGRQLFQANCAPCHGASGAGGIRVGDTTSADLKSPGLEQMYHDNDALLRRAILDGKDEDGKPLDPAMPRWRGRLSEQQVNDIIAYLKTLH